MTGRMQELARHARLLQDEELAERASVSVERRLAAVHERLGRRSVQAARLRTPLLAAAALLIASVVLVVVRRPPEPVLVAETAGHTIEVGAWLVSDDAEVPIGFSDGTTLTLASSARARLLSVNQNGAELALERGRVTASVVSKKDARWVVSAGPFRILVTGTKFDAVWEPDTEVLSVKMDEGSVRVSGTCLSAPQGLSAGEGSDFSCRKITSAPAAPVPEPERFVETSSAEPKSPKQPAATNPNAITPSAGVDPPDWRSLSRDGRFREALSAAEKRGFSALAASESASAVLELGNVARLAGNPARANEAYSTVRQRFGGSSASAQAAFQLGRIAFDGTRDYASARRWFAAYLAEQPGGGFAQEALGRLMEAENRSGDRAAAELSARRYLERFPNGGHAGLAHSLTAK